MWNVYIQIYRMPHTTVHRPGYLPLYLLVKIISKWLQRELTKPYRLGAKSSGLSTRILFLPETLCSLVPTQFFLLLMFFVCLFDFD